MATNWAHRERAVLANELDGAGPDAPTLCEGWQTRDLAAHLVVRERRPDASLGIVIKPLAGHLDRVTEATAQNPYAELVERFRTGPGKLSPFAIPGVEAAANIVEFFVHTEDVRRAQPGWEPRDLDPGLNDALWARLKAQSKLVFRNAKVPLTLVRTDTGEAVEFTAKPGSPAVTITGDVGELVLHAFGRNAARVEVTGPEDLVAKYGQADRSV